MTGGTPTPDDDAMLNRRRLLYLGGAAALGTGSVVAFAQRTARTPVNTVDVDADATDAIADINPDPGDSGPKDNGFDGSNIENPGRGRSGEISEGNLARLEAADHAADLEFTLELTTLPDLEDELARLDLEVGLYAGGTKEATRNLNLRFGSTSFEEFSNIAAGSFFALAVERGSYTLRGGSGGNFDIGFLVAADFWAP